MLIARRNAIFCVVRWNDHRHLLRPWDKVHVLWGECNGPCSVLSGQRELTPIAAASGTSRRTQGVRCDGVEHGRSLVPGSGGGREGGTCRCEPFRVHASECEKFRGSGLHGSLGHARGFDKLPSHSFSFWIRRRVDIVKILYYPVRQGCTRYNTLF